MDEQAFLKGLDELRELVESNEATYEQARKEAELYAGAGGNLLEQWDSFTPAELRIIYAGGIDEVRLSKPSRRTNGHPPLAERVRVVWKSDRTSTDRRSR